MRAVFLTRDEYRFVASLPDDERRLFLELVQRLDARFVDSRDPSQAFFLAELDDGSTRHVTPEPW